MNIESLVKNKFIIAIPVALLLVVCLKKFNEFRNINNEDENKQGGEKNDEDKSSYDIKYYLKSLIICYLLGIVFVILINSSRRLQNLVTFASSSGASTSSSTHIGDGLVKNTAKIRDRAVKACSPPDSKVID